MSQPNKRSAAADLSVLRQCVIFGYAADLKEIEGNNPVELTPPPTCDGCLRSIKQAYICVAAENNDAAEVLRSLEDAGYRR